MILVAGRIVLRAGTFEQARPHMERVITETRREAGCRTYTFARDVLEPDTIRIFEIWESREALDAHGAAPHMHVWRAALQEIGVVARELQTWDTDEGQPL